MQKINFNSYDFVFFVGFIVWFVETAYFGFNQTPINNIERFFDHVSLFLIGYGFIFSFLFNCRQPINFKINSN